MAVAAQLSTHDKDFLTHMTGLHEQMVKAAQSYLGAGTAGDRQARVADLARTVMGQSQDNITKIRDWMRQAGYHGPGPGGRGSMMGGGRGAA